MLEELDIRNVAVAEHVRLTLSDGFIALTGETRAGAERAQIEGVFRLPANPDAALLDAMEEARIEPEDGALIISRDVPSRGRSTARVNGRAVVQSALRALGA